MPAEVATRPLLRYLSISGVLEPQIKRGQIHWKANIPGYNFYEETFPEFYHY
jgi:hypothetical protein